VNNYLSLFSLSQTERKKERRERKKERKERKKEKVSEC
jgi:hypothetical protein